MANGLFDLSGKSALVTGGNSGIGLGFAEGLARHGADVCVWGTNAEKNARAEEILKRYGGKVAAMQCDVSDQERVRESFARTVERFGKVDSCFANAGIGSRGTPFIEMTTDEWRDIFRVNMDGVFFTLQTAVQHMIECNVRGSLVVTSSGSTMFGAPRAEHYAATKGGLLAMIKGLAVEHARHGIRANAVIPGWIDTPMTAAVVNNEAFLKKVLPRIPARRWGTGNDFSAIAVYFASDASAYHTGDTVVIDGGYGCF